MVVSLNKLKRKYVQSGQSLLTQEISSGGLFLSSSSWVISITSILWLAQVSPLKSMDLSKNRLEESTHSSLHTQFYKDTDHPLTQEFWKGKDFSKRLRNLRAEIELRKQEILNYKINSINITNDELETYKNILKCTQCETDPVSDLHKAHLDNLFTCNKPRKPNSGWSSGTDVSILGKEGRDFIVIKKFDNIKKGMEELFYSLIALDINPAPQGLKMARIYDAIICPQNSLSIIMEAANTTNIHHFLSGNSAIYAVKACAEYLAIFHIENHHKLNNYTDGKKHLHHVSQFFHTLIEDTLAEQDKVYKLLSLRPRESVSDSQFVQSDNVVSLLPEKDQERFEHLVKINRDQLKKNTEKVYRSLLNNTEKERSYFLTMTHGDAHAHNFFYDDSNLTQNGLEIPCDSFLRVSMIDFASIIKTYGNIGDPAEDVGRFSAALWNWWAIENDHDDKKVLELQDAFISYYLETVKEGKIIAAEKQGSFERKFKQNCNFYKLRYYRAIFNVKKNNDLEKDIEIKKKFLESWIKETSTQENSSLENPEKFIQRERGNGRFWQPVCTDQRKIICWLPDRELEFIESGEKGSESHLTRLWKELHQQGTATISSTAAIAGMGGIGKTTLALEYAHEALENNAYNLIYWINCETETSFFNAYRNLLLKIVEPERRASIKYETNEGIIKLIKRYIRERGKCLLGYDNVPDADFLKGKTPEEAHNLITTRCNQGWEKPPLVLNVFCTEDSIKYLLRVTGVGEVNIDKDVAEAAEQLAKELEHFPLALALAGHYIKLVGGKNVSKKHFKAYLEGFKDEGLKSAEENRNPLTEAQSKITYENLIAKTLRISTKYISQIAANSMLAEEIMAFCAYLSPNAIREDIFLEYCQDKEQSEKALELLCGLSFLKKAKDDGTFSIHRLVQLVLRNKKELEIPPQLQYEKIFSKIVPVFHKLFERNIHTEEQVSKSLDNLQHIISLLENSMRLKSSSPSLEYLQWIGWLIEGVESINLHKEYEIHLQNILNNPQLFQKRIIESFLNETLERGKNPSHIIDLLTGEKTRRALELFELLCSEFSTISSDDIRENREDMENVLGRLMQVSGVPKNRTKHLATSFIQERLLFDSLKRNKDVPQQISQIVNNGHPSLQAALGSLYRRNKEMDKAFYWFSKAAEGKDSVAQYALGVMCIENKKYAKAADWYTKSAEQGHPNAQYNLGIMYAKGEGVKFDEKLATKYLTMAAKQEHAEAQSKLGALYIKKQDVDNAILWFEKAAQNGNTQATYMLGLSYKIKEEHTKAVECFKIAAQKGHIEAHYHLGIAYEDGKGTQKDIGKAIRCYTIAAKQEHIGAQFSLGKLYFEKKDIDQAILWLEKAAKAPSILADASYMLGLSYKIKEDHIKAVECFKIAAQKGHIEAHYHLGMAYEDGKGTSKNIQEAIRCYIIAAQQGHISAKNIIQQFSENISQDENEDALKGISYIYEAEECFKKGDKDLAEYFIKEAVHMFSLVKDDIQLGLIIKNSSENSSQEQSLSEPAAKIEKETIETDGEDRDSYLSEGDYFLAQASKYEEEGNWDMAEYFAKKASEHFSKNSKL